MKDVIQFNCKLDSDDYLEFELTGDNDELKVEIVDAGDGGLVMLTREDATRLRDFLNEKYPIAK